jgi:hypothetical protein
MHRTVTRVHLFYAASILYIDWPKDLAWLTVRHEPKNPPNINFELYSYMHQIGPCREWWRRGLSFRQYTSTWMLFLWIVFTHQISCESIEGHRKFVQNFYFCRDFRWAPNNSIRSGLPTVKKSPNLWPIRTGKGNVFFEWKQHVQMANSVNYDRHGPRSIMKICHIHDHPLHTE